MIIIFFPTMAINAVKRIRTSFFIENQFFGFIPLSADFGLQLRIIWSFVILPIMSIDTFKFIMVDFVERAKLTFEKMKKKVLINFHFVKKLNFQFLVTMGKCTIFSEFTSLFFKIRFTVFFFVVVWVIKLFNRCVSISTFGVLASLNKFADHFAVKTTFIRPSFFRIKVVINTFFDVMF